MTENPGHDPRNHVGRLVRLPEALVRRCGEDAMSRAFRDAIDALNRVGIVDPLKFVRAVTSDDDLDAYERGLPK